MAPAATFAGTFPPRRVLIIKPSALGDVVTAMPVLRGIRRTFPQAHVSWLVANSCAELVRHDRDLNDTILFDRKRLGRAWRSPGAMCALLDLLRKLRQAKFDWVIDLQGLLRSGLLSAVTGAPVRCGFANAREGAARFYTHAVQVRSTHTVDRNLELAAFLAIDARPEDFTLHVSHDAAAFAHELLAKQGLKGHDFLAVFPPTRWRTKLYPVRHWRSVVTELSRDLSVVVMGGPGDREMCQGIVQDLKPAGAYPVVNLAGETSVEQMVALISVSRGVICSDSAAKFIAPAVGVNVLSLLGPTRLELTGPYVPGPHVAGESIVAQVACQGCLKKRCRHITCMEMIDPRRVVKAARGMLHRS